MIPRPKIALEARLRNCSGIVTLGVRPNFSDYTTDEIDMLRRAKKVYYPSSFYADLFDAMGKKTFPSYHTYKFAQDKIKQTALFQLLDIPHPQTRVFYGKRQKSKIEDYFRYPMVAKVARGSAMGRGVYLIESRNALAAYCQAHHSAYIQEYLAIDKDIRVIIIGKEVVHAYWRVAPPGDFRTNVAQGGQIHLENVPEEATSLALTVALQCGWDDVGIDICQYNRRFYVLEANMKYGKEGFRQAGIDYAGMMEKLLHDGKI
jgi:ribosomal protein S6--L-glutamate ligase